ncbi:MAG: PD-(D/E)XK nuclease family protein [Lachnospiraceae bacterium]
MSMALQMILGGAGSGKSVWLYDHIRKEAEKHPEQTYLVLVPEQFTLSTQMEFVNRQPEHCIMNIDVLSFERLAYRVFDELGISDLKVLEDIGKTLVIRKVAREKENELKVLKKNLDRPGYLDQIKSQLTEFAQYYVTVDKLEKALSGMPQDLLYYKLRDLKILYEGMEEYLAQNYITAEKLLILLSEVAHKSALLRNAVVAFDGYTGFTPVQMRFLKAWAPMVQDLYATVLVDVREDYMKVGASHELFYPGKKYIASLVRLAEETGMEQKDPVIMPASSMRRFRGHEGLAALEENLFRVPAKSLVTAGEDVTITALKNPRQELLYVAAKIHQYTGQGLRYHDMAIVTADLDTYADEIRGVFEKAGIPFFVDQKKKITYNSFTELLKGLMDMVRLDFSYEAVFRYLKTGLSNLTRQEVEALENYCLAARVRGSRRYQEPFSYMPQGYTLEEMDRVNEIRQHFIEPLEELCNLGGSCHSVGVLAATLYRCVDGLGLEEKLYHLSGELESSGQFQKAREYSQIYGLVMDLLDKYVALMGEEEICFEEFEKIFTSGLDCLQVSAIPAGRDCVILGDLERTRLEHVKVLFLVGANEGVIPRVSTGSICLTQNERSRLEELGMELAAGPRDRIFMQRFYLYMVMSKPQEALHMTYSLYSMAGEVRKPSYLIDTVQALFPALEVKEETQEDLLGYQFTPKLAFSNMVEHVERPEEQEYLYYFMHQPEYRQQMESLLGASRDTQTGEQMDQELVKQLYTDTIRGSVTRLESMARCSMQHFFNYGLKLKERQTGKYTMLDMGNLFHSAMENYSRYLEEEHYTYSSVPAAKREEYAERAVRDAVADLNQIYLYENARNRYQTERLIRIVKRTVWALAKQMETAGFSPVSCEKKFTIKAQEDSMLKLSGDFSMELTGKIDRIDVRQEQEDLRYRVIDYKSGNTTLSVGKVYDGTQLQLMTYEHAAGKLMKKQYPGEQVVCDGVYYYRMKDPMVKIESEITEEEIDALLYDELRLEGAGISTEDESISEKSKTYGKEHLNTLTAYSRHKIHELGEAVVSGELVLNPISMADTVCCEYCDYRQACGFDRRIHGNCVRKETTGKEEEVLAQMLQELEEEEQHGD